MPIYKSFFDTSIEDKGVAKRNAVRPLVIDIGTGGGVYC